MGNSFYFQHCPNIYTILFPAEMWILPILFCYSLFIGLISDKINGEENVQQILGGKGNFKKFGTAEKDADDKDKNAGLAPVNYDDVANKTLSAIFQRIIAQRTFTEYNEMAKKARAILIEWQKEEIEEWKLPTTSSGSRDIKKMVQKIVEMEEIKGIFQVDKKVKSNWEEFVKKLVEFNGRTENAKKVGEKVAELMSEKENGGRMSPHRGRGHAEKGAEKNNKLAEKMKEEEMELEKWEHEKVALMEWLKEMVMDPIGGMANGSVPEK